MEEKIQYLDSKIKIERWREDDIDEISSFSCGVKPLDEIFHHQLSPCFRYRYITPYVVRLISTNEIVAIFTLENDRVILESDEAREELVNDLFPGEADIVEADDFSYFLQQLSFPAINIGHLGVRKDMHRRHIGRAIFYFVLDTYLTYNISGCQFITVDAINNPETNTFYNSLGFQNQTNSDSTRKTRRKIFPLFLYQNEAGAGEQEE